jgi:hypothetical protein
LVPNLIFLNIFKPEVLNSDFKPNNIVIHCFFGLAANKIHVTKEKKEFTMKRRKKKKENILE